MSKNNVDICEVLAKIKQEVEGVDIIDEDLIHLVIQAHANRSNNTVEKLFEACKISLEVFLFNEILDIVDAKSVSRDHLAKYFAGKDGPTNKFVSLLEGRSPVSKQVQHSETGTSMTLMNLALSNHTSDLLAMVAHEVSVETQQPIDGFSQAKQSASISDTKTIVSDAIVHVTVNNKEAHEPAPSSLQTAILTGSELGKSNNDLSANTLHNGSASIVEHSKHLMYDQSDVVPNIQKLFEIPLERRILYNSLAVDRFEGSMSEFKQMCLEVADIVFVDLSNFAWSQPINHTASSWHDLSIKKEWFQRAAAALVSTFPCTNTDIFYKYQKGAQTTQTGHLYQKLKGKRRAEKRAGKTQSQGQPPVKRSKIGVYLEDPLSQSWLLTAENDERYLDLYTTELIDKGRRNEPGVLMKCYGLQGKNSILVRLPSYRKFLFLIFTKVFYIFLFS